MERQTPQQLWKELENVFYRVALWIFKMLLHAAIEKDRGVATPGIKN